MLSSLRHLLITNNIWPCSKAACNPTTHLSTPNYITTTIIIIIVTTTTVTTYRYDCLVLASDAFHAVVTPSPVKCESRDPY